MVDQVIHSLFVILKIKYRALIHQLGIISKGSIPCVHSPYAGIIRIRLKGLVS
jgi:hypothetical protein